MNLQNNITGNLLNDNINFTDLFSHHFISNQRVYRMNYSNKNGDGKSDELIKIIGMLVDYNYF